MMGSGCGADAVLRSWELLEACSQQQLLERIGACCCAALPGRYQGNNWRKTCLVLVKDPAARAELQMHVLASQEMARTPPGWLRWGNQQTIWTLSRGAVTAQSSPRTVALAKPKRSFDGKLQRRPLFLYSCGRESAIWERPLLVDFGLPSDRLLKLSEPKKCQAAYLRQRPRQRPEWPVPPGALSCEASPRILQLARPKALHPAFLPAGEVETHVTNAAALARPSLRLQRLAEPRVRQETCCYDRGRPEAAIRPVSKSAQQAVASPRTLELAGAKRLLPDYMPLQDAEWLVTKAALRAVATPRLVELAQPRKRPPMDLTQFNPEAFTVKETAKKATCSARLQDLARPVKH